MSKTKEYSSDVHQKNRWASQNTKWC